MRFPTLPAGSCLQKVHQHNSYYWFPVLMFAGLTLSAPASGATPGGPIAATQSAKVTVHASPAEKATTKTVTATPAKTVVPAPKVEQKAKVVPPVAVHPRPAKVVHHQAVVKKLPVSPPKKVPHAAATQATKAASVQRNVDRALLQQARAAYWHGQIPQAIADYQELIRRDPLPRYYGELGNIYFQMGARQAAAYTYVLAAKALIAAGRPLEAGALLPTIQALNPAAARALLANPSNSKKETH